MLVSEFLNRKIRKIILHLSVVGTWTQILSQGLFLGVCVYIAGSLSGSILSSTIWGSIFTTTIQLLSDMN